ncbi:MAG TPA: UbiA-like polyprenyltransferase [Chthoniobacterales bacterium]|nr:UbiA-like polyprenyltransferase [Chthoniobacterales bacterium]
MPPVPATSLARFLQLIRFSHTIFALPFALGALFVAAEGWPSLRILALVLTCMVLARTAAMLYNRLADWSIDQRNPRTAARHLLVPKPIVCVLLVCTAVSFIVAAAAINRLAALLSPLALAIIFFYSLTKRFTHATHFFLGLALAVAPAGAWIAQTGRLGLPPLVLGLAVICWVAGFDLIYAIQDAEFDRREGLKSMVVKLGVRKSLRLAQWLHFGVFVVLLAFGAVAGLGLIYYCAMPLIAAALIYEHRSVGSLDVVSINRAFFQSNAFVSAIFLLAVAADVLRGG